MGPCGSGIRCSDDTDLSLGAIGAGGSGEVVGQEVGGEKEARGDPYLTLCGHLPLLQKPWWGSEQVGA